MEQQKKIYSFYRPFPENLIMELYKENHWGDFPREISENQKKGLKYVLATLSELEELLIKERYEVHKSIKTIAKESNFDRRFIQSIVTRAKKKLSHQRISEYIINGYQYTKQKEKKDSEEAKKKAETLIDAAEKKIKIPNLGSLSISSIGLSTRTKNVLAGNSITTVFDLVYLLVKRYEDALDFRHFGATSLQEVVEKLGDYEIGIAIAEGTDHYYKTLK